MLSSLYTSHRILNMLLVFEKMNLCHLFRCVSFSTADEINILFIIHYSMGQNNLKLPKKTEPFTTGVGSWLAFVHIYLTTETGGIPLHPLQPLRARFLCRASDYFWHSTVQCTLGWSDFE